MQCKEKGCNIKRNKAVFGSKKFVESGCKPTGTKRNTKGGQGLTSGYSVVQEKEYLLTHVVK